MLTNVSRNQREDGDVLLVKDPTESAREYAIDSLGVRLTFDAVSVNGNELHLLKGDKNETGVGKVLPRNSPRWLREELKYVAENDRLIPGGRYETRHKPPHESDNGY